MSCENQALPCHNCPICGGPNACKSAQTGSHEGEPCWCTTVTFSKSLLDKVPPALRSKACICQACALADQSKDDRSS